MRRKRHHKNTLERMRHVCEIVQQHYEPGNQARCYYRVWYRYVYPVYPMSYHTMLRYISTNIGKEECESEDARQLKLF